MFLVKTCQKAIWKEEAVGVWEKEQELRNRWDTIMELAAKLIFVSKKGESWMKIESACGLLLQVVASNFSLFLFCLT